MILEIETDFSLSAQVNTDSQWWYNLRLATHSLLRFIIFHNDLIDRLATHSPYWFIIFNKDLIDRDWLLTLRTGL